MTQPSLNETFDTSLIDLGPQDSANESFSTSSSTIPSDSGPQLWNATDVEASAPSSTTDLPSTLAISSPAPLPSSDFTNSRGIPTHYLPTATAYDEWAGVYDADGNILQSVDDVELQSLLPELQRLVVDNLPGQGTLRLIDLGCGTGRNTSKLLQMQWPTGLRVQITGYDASRGMLDVAQTKLDAAHLAMGSPANLTYRLTQHDFLDPADAFAPPVFPSGPEEGVRADALISTLVIEHFPLQPFFGIVSALMRVGGLILLTNMHEEMGKVSQAGFERKNEDTGEVVKVRGCSWVHKASEVVEAARVQGLELVESEGTASVREVAVTNEMVESGIVSQRGSKWIDKKVWFGMVLRRVT